MIVFFFTLPFPSRQGRETPTLKSQIFFAETPAMRLENNLLSFSRFRILNDAFHNLSVAQSCLRGCGDKAGIR